MACLRSIGHAENDVRIRIMCAQICCSFVVDALEALSGTCGIALSPSGRRRVPEQAPFVLPLGTHCTAERAAERGRGACKLQVAHQPNIVRGLLLRVFWLY